MRYRRAVTLYYFDDRSVPEVAAMLGIPEGTVKTNLYRARETLLAQLGTLGLKDISLPPDFHRRLAAAIASLPADEFAHRHDTRLAVDRCKLRTARQACAGRDRCGGGNRDRFVEMAAPGRRAVLSAIISDRAGTCDPVRRSVTNSPGSLKECS